MTPKNRSESATNKIKYYLFTSFRRKMIDQLFIENEHCFKGVVLDIGGRDRGRFVKPKQKVEKWIFADIEASHQPDLVLDVAKMDKVQDGSIDVVCAAELFEHVEKTDQGLSECYRVLKSGGTMIITVPFIRPIHADPYDFQRWTKDKWTKTTQGIGFKTEKIEVMGRFFTSLAEMLIDLIRSLPRPIRYLAYPAYPAINILTKLDQTKFVLNNNKLSGYHGGYFIVLRK